MAEQCNDVTSLLIAPNQHSAVRACRHASHVALAMYSYVTVVDKAVDVQQRRWLTVSVRGMCKRTMPRLLGLRSELWRIIVVMLTK